MVNFYVLVDVADPQLEVARHSAFMEVDAFLFAVPILIVLMVAVQTRAASILGGNCGRVCAHNLVNVCMYVEIASLIRTCTTV